MGDGKTDPFLKRYWDKKQLLTKNTVTAHIDTYFHLTFNVRQTFDTSMNMYDDYVRKLSFLKLGTGVKEFLEGHQIFWSCFIGVPNISEKIVKYLLGCEIFRIYFRLK